MQFFRECQGFFEKIFGSAVITFIFGLRGVGKAALMTYFLKSMYERQRTSMLRFTCDKIAWLNEVYGKDFSMPTQAPIFVQDPNYKVKLKVGYEKWFTPYKFDIGHFGLPTAGNKDVQLIPPGSALFVPELQDIFNSRNWTEYPRSTSAAFEKSRQWWLKFFFDCQRPKSVEVTLRELGDRFITPLRLENKYNFAGGVEKTTFHCLEFSSWRDANAYYDSGITASGKFTKYVNKGNIFNCYDSYACSEEFIPKDTTDFIYEMVS